MDGIRLTEERIEQFLAALSARGRAEMTVRQYRSCLCALRAYLGSGGLLNRESLAQWKQALEESGDYSNSTINVRLAAVNSFLEYVEKPEWSVRERLLTPASSRPALTREEYLALLRAAVALGNRQTYCIVKTLCCLGVQVGELHHITVETAARGYGRWIFQHAEHRITVPEPLRGELLDFAAVQGVRRGPIFRNRTGKPVDRGTVCGQVAALAEAAGVERQKATTGNLTRLYEATLDEIAAGYLERARADYRALLESEESAAHWTA